MQQTRPAKQRKRARPAPAPPPAPTEPSAQQPKQTRKRFSSWEDQEILLGIDTYQNSWQQVVDDSRSLHLQANGRSARSIQTRYNLLKAKLLPQEHQDTTPTPVNREKIITAILCPEQAKQVIEHRVHQQTKYVINTEDKPKLVRSVSDGELDKVNDVREYLADRRMDRELEMDQRSRKRKQRQETDESKENGEKEATQDKGKEKEKEKEVDTTTEDEGSQDMGLSNTAVAQFKEHHERQSTKRARTKQKEQKKETEDALTIWLEMQEKLTEQREKRQEEKEQRREDTLLTILREQQKQSQELAAAMLAMAAKLVAQEK